jgi:CheY-like chemotaxis protein
MRREAMSEESNAMKPPILIVDDLETQRLLYKLLLSRLGLDGDVVESSDEAERLMLDRRYALVIMDWVMPDIDGLSAVQRLRERTRSTVPMVCITAKALDGDRERCLESGMDDYLSKPFTIEQFESFVSRWLNISLASA